MEVRNKIYFTIGILLFYLGDLITTYTQLQNGGYEANIILARLGFYGTVLLKTLYIAMVFIFVSFLEKKKKYAQEIGVMMGSVIAYGLFAVLNNLGFYQ